MRKLMIAGLAASLTASALAPAAHARPINVVPSESVIARHTPRPEICGVLIGYRQPNEVRLYCAGRASAWVMFRVRGVGGEVTGVSYSWRGRCFSVSGTWNIQGDAVLLKLVGRGAFDCYITDITVRTGRSPARSLGQSPGNANILAI